MPVRPASTPLLHQARRRVATWTAWVAVVAVAGLSLALRRRRAEEVLADEPEEIDETAPAVEVR